MKRLACILLLALLPLPALAAEENPMFHQSGLPIPRFVSLKSSEINVRVGPGERYPIAWVYHKRELPVEIFEEFGHWRHIRDSDGAEGWVHATLLSGMRTALIRERARPLYLAPDAASTEVMVVDPLVPGRIEECLIGWCQLRFGDHKGWIRRDYLWGVYEDELYEAD